MTGVESMENRGSGLGKEGGANRRRHPRIRTSNHVAFVCIDEDGNEVAEGIGSALDLSLGGVKLATKEPVETPFILLLAVDLEDDLLEVKGRVVYSQRSDDGRYTAGIRFVDAEEKHHRIIRNFVKAYAHLTRRHRTGLGAGAVTSLQSNGQEDG
jgi:c-di-GMP-binding flagellar brake protein YcgR